MNKALALFVIAPLILADAPPPWRHDWIAQHPKRAVKLVDVNIVRGQIHRVTSDGPPKVLVRLVSGKASDVQIEITTTEQGLSVRDIYPPAPMDPARECLPAAGDRGAFWNSDVIFDVTVSAPAPLVVRHHVMDERPIKRDEDRAATPDAAQ